MPVAYAWVRAIERIILPRENPLAVVSVTQSGFFARCLVAVFAGGMAAFGGYRLAAKPARAARALVWAAGLSALVLALVAGFVP